jgi:hypothetical protein
MKNVVFIVFLLFSGNLFAQTPEAKEKKSQKSLSSIFSRKEEGQAKKEKKDKNVAQPDQSSAKSTGVSIAAPDERITNPALRIRTKTREFTLGYRTVVSIVTTDNRKIKSNIIDMDSKSLTLDKDNTNIPYDKIKTIRIRPTRRIWKWLAMPTITYPIYWTAISKGLHVDSKKCKKNIQEFKLVNRFVEFKYGKDNCN